MQSNKGADTKPELIVRSALHAKGHRYHVNYRPLSDKRRSVDIAFPATRLAVFIDGCFWHGCPAHGTMPATNSRYWSAKIARNRERDLETAILLERAGWRSLRLWEHEPVSVCVDAIERELVVIRAIGERKPYPSSQR